MLLLLLQLPAPATAATTSPTNTRVPATAAASAASAGPAVPQGFIFGPEAERYDVVMLKRKFSEFKNLPFFFFSSVRSRKSARGPGRVQDFPSNNIFFPSLKAVKLCQVQDRDSHCNTMPVCLLALLKLWIMNFY